MPSSGFQTCALDRKSTRLNSSHTIISYAVFCLKKRHNHPVRTGVAVGGSGQGRRAAGRVLQLVGGAPAAGVDTTDVEGEAARAQSCFFVVWGGPGHIPSFPHGASGT